MRRLITPVQFAELIRAAQTYRVRECSCIEAATQACRHLGLSDDWAAPLLGFLNDSPTIAEAWADRMFDEALDRAYARAEQEHQP